jgi:two-component system OmpR family sensor kinase
MTLTTRLTSFFLGVLACVLVGFAIGLYALASYYLHNEAAGRLDAALHALAASADVNSEGVEWEPASRSLTLSDDASPDQIRWLVRDDRGREVDRSRNLSDDKARQFADAWSGRTSDDQAIHVIGGESWRLLHLRIAASGAGGEGSREPPAKMYRALRLTVGNSLAPIQSTLRNLVLALTGLSLGLWCVAAIGGRWLCRRALAPVTRMADAARDIGADDWRARLPAPATRDELEDLARAFNDLLNRLEESFERQRRFTGDASHQLRTPLTAMLGQLDVALLRQRTPDEYRRALDSVQSQADRLRQIVETQLFLARADAEALDPQLEVVDLATWLCGHLESWRGHPRSPDFDCEMGEEKRAMVRTHPQLLAQLLDNVLDNAAKYSPAGTPIRMRVTVAETTVECSVEDSGSGIAPDDLPHIFEPFYRSEEARRLGINGAGLGLAVAHRIAAALGGAIRAEAARDGGARFVFRLQKTSLNTGIATGVDPLFNPETSATAGPFASHRITTNDANNTNVVRGRG